MGCLRDGLQVAIRDSKTFVLVWSKAASKSRWVIAELLTAIPPRPLHHSLRAGPDPAAAISRQRRRISIRNGKAEDSARCSRAADSHRARHLQPDHAVDRRRPSWR